MLAFDASSIIHAWDNYPEKQFPPLWKWISDNIENGEFVMAQVAFEEVKKKSPDCATFLKGADLKQVKMNNAIAQEAVRIKGRLGIQNEEYHPDGVGENDIYIIATAKSKIWNLCRKKADKPSNPARTADSRFRVCAGCLTCALSASTLSS